MISEGWVQYELRELLGKKGYIRGPFGSALRRPEMKQSGIPVYEQQHAIYGIRDFRFFIDELKFKELSRFQVQTNDLIISCSGTLGKISIIKESDPKGIISQALLLLRPNTHVVLPKFLEYHFSTPFGFNQLVQASYGSVQQNIASRKTVEDIKINLPPIHNQQRVISILSSLDDKIELNLRMNKTLEAIAQAIFKDWFVDFRFPEFDGKLVNGLPREWRRGKLGEIIVNFDSKRVPLSSRQREKRKGIYPYYGAVSIMDYIDDYLFDGTYLLMGEDGSVIDEKGYPILQYVWGKFWVNNHAHVIQGVKPFSTEYIYILLKGTPISNIVTGAVQPKINQGNLNSIKCIIPNDIILHEFNKLVLPVFERMKVNIVENKILSSIRDTLLPKLMTGKIKVA